MDNLPIGTPTVDDVRHWPGLPSDDHLDDDLIQTSLDAAVAAQSRVCVWPCNDDGDAQYDPDLFEAALLRTQRYMARRSSPEGIVGITGTDGDFVGARLPSTDADIVRLESPFMKMVVS